MSAVPFPTQFSSVLDIASLPWFDVVGGTRIVADPAVGPIIDMHTHVAMAYLLKHRVDVMAETPMTSYYLPVSSPVDLAIYSNKNFDDHSLWAMKLDMSLLSVTPWGMRRTHTAANLQRDMRALGIVNAVLLPFDVPIGPSNASVVLDVCDRFDEFIPFGSVHPIDRKFEAKFAQQIQRGARGMKFHPNGQFIAPDHPKVVHMCRRCGDAQLPVLFHCGPVGIEPKSAEQRSQVARYERAIAENPDTTFVLGHCGALQSSEAIQFSERYDNLYYEVSCLGLEAMAEVFDTVDHSRILYGSDWPFYHQSLTLARVLMLTEGSPASRRAILHDNAARLLEGQSPIGDQGS